MTAEPPADIRSVVYLGTPQLAVAPLIALHESGYDIPLVVSRRDARRGRGGSTQPSPVKRAAMELGLDVSDDLDALETIDADLGVVVAYGRIIGAGLLDRLAFVNLHFSLLPRWRGAAPVERAILAGDTHTGVCLMALEEQLDTGPVYRRSVVEIDPDETLEVLRGRLVAIGTQQLTEALGEGLGEPQPQVGEPVYASKITTADREIDWCGPAEAIHRQIRVGGAFTTFRGKRFKIHKAELLAATGSVSAVDPGRLEADCVGTANGTLRLIEVQSEGKPRQAAVDWLNGARLIPADRLGS